MNSDLAQEFRLVAMDIRGHGFSEKPYVGYDDSINWANDALESDQTLQKYVLLCFNRFPSVYDYFFILGFNKIVPPYVREGMTSRNQSNNDLLPKIKLPVLITHGDQDNIVLLRTAFHTARLMPQAQMHSIWVLDIPFLGRAYSI